MWRDVASDCDVAAVKDLERLFVHLNESLSCLSQRLHGRVKSDRAALATTTELHLVEINVGHLSRVTLPRAFGGIGFNIAADLITLSEG